MIFIYLFIKYHIFWYILSINVDFIESSLYTTKFYSIYGQKKRSLRLSRREAQALIEGDYSVLLNSGSEFGQECYSIMEMWAYRPKTVVEYDRFAFIAPENSIRITFDSGIRANEVNFNIFDRNLVLNSVMSPFAVVLEVKYNGFLLSYIKHMLLPVQKSELSVSKYCMARQIGCDYRF